MKTKVKHSELSRWLEPSTQSEFWGPIAYHLEKMSEMQTKWVTIHSIKILSYYTHMLTFEKCFPLLLKEGLDHQNEGFLNALLGYIWVSIHTLFPAFLNTFKYCLDLLNSLHSLKPWVLALFYPPLITFMTSTNTTGQVCIILKI